MGPEWLDLLVVLVALYGAATWAALRLPCWPFPHRASRPRPSSRARVPTHPVQWVHAHRRRQPLQPSGRPIELIAVDARRLGERFRNPPRGTSFAKVQAVRHAYDHVLVEGCTALGIEHLLEVLPPGAELDAERTRVEGMLWLAGMRIDGAA